METTISVKNLRKVFRTKAKSKGFSGNLKSLFFPKFKESVAVNNVSFEVDKGELVGFIGPNGAGKSTTLKMLTGILFPTSGKINVLGYNPQKERVKLAYHLGSIFGQKQQLWYHLPPIDSFELFSHIYELKKRDYHQRLEELVKLFGISSLMYMPVKKLSLGERMRCELVASLLHRPKVLFLDEPTIGMDILAKHTMREYVAKINQKEKTTVLLTSHDLDDIEELCQRVIIINQGKILYDGRLENIKNKLKYKLVELSFKGNADNVPLLHGVKIIEQKPCHLKLEIDKTKTSPPEVLSHYFSKCKVFDVVIEDPPIEEVIKGFYKK